MTPLYSWLSQYINKAIYVWGARGENVCAMKKNNKYDPEGWIKSKEQTDEKASTAIKLFRERLAEGLNPVTAFDCSGLVVCMLRHFGILSPTGNRNSKGLYSMCNSHPSRNELKCGDFVFSSDTEGKASEIHHVGVYVGGGKVVECKGRAYGVVETDIENGYPWNMFGRLDKIEPYTMEEPDEPYIFRLTSPRQKGPEVLELQRFLNFCHYRDENGDALDEDGIYGKHTDRALLGFAAWYGFIEPDAPTPHTVTINTEPFTVIIDGETVLKAPGGDEA